MSEIIESEVKRMQNKYLSQGGGDQSPQGGFIDEFDSPITPLRPLEDATIIVTLVAFCLVMCFLLWLCFGGRPSW